MVASQTRVGDWVYFTATLLDEVGKPTVNSANVTLTAIGTYSGVFNLPLTPDANGGSFWSTKYTLRTRETITFELAVAGIVLDRHNVTISGVAPNYLNLSRSLAAACLTNVLGGGGNGSVCESAVDPSARVLRGATLLVPKSKDIKLMLPVYTVTGDTWLSDPGLSVVLSLVPSAQVDAIQAAYNTSLRGSALRRLLKMVGIDAEPVAAAVESAVNRGRRLVQVYGSVYNGTQTYDYPSYTGRPCSQIHVWTVASRVAFNA